MTRKKPTSSALTEQAVLVLASLSQGELHGYGIARDVEELSQGRVRLTAGTLYGVLNRLRDEGLIEQTREEIVSGRRRRYHQLTALGHTVLRDEAARLSATAAAVGTRAAARRPRPA
jgi:DNA-binding PadR family transcriptional regulator